MNLETNYISKTGVCSEHKIAYIKTNGCPKCNKKEYVVWGIRPNEAEESLLLTTDGMGQKITSKDFAYGMAEVLKSKYGCKNVRVQEIDFLNHPKFV